MNTYFKFFPAFAPVGRRYVNNIIVQIRRDQCSRKVYSSGRDDVTEVKRAKRPFSHFSSITETTAFNACAISFTIIICSLQCNVIITI